MSGLFGDDEATAAEKLLRTGGSAGRTILTAPSPQSVADRDPFAIESQREEAHEKLKRKHFLNEFWRRKGVDVDDVERETWHGYKFHDNKTESQKEREGNIAKRLREWEKRMEEESRKGDRGLGPRPRPWDI